jgi:hypothetical protein
MGVPEAIAGQITASFDGVDVTKAASNFSNICRDVGCGDRYWVYGILSRFVHLSVFTSNAYIESASGALLLAARRATSECSDDRALRDLCPVGPGLAPA